MLHYYDNAIRVKLVLMLTGLMTDYLSTKIYYYKLLWKGELCHYVEKEEQKDLNKCLSFLSWNRKLTRYLLWYNNNLALYYIF